MSDTKARRLLSGIKPTGDLQVGNYFGMMKQPVDLQDEFSDMFIFVADFHALNQVQDAQELDRMSHEVVKGYMAVGLDPAKVVLYRQSDSPRVTELTWIFNTITPVAVMEMAHAYKDAIANGKHPHMGLFDYPVLMAADILLYDTHVVPVGKDQQQHVEIAREIARDFNRIFGQTFVEPQALIREDVAVVPGTDGRKMSKSYNNTIPLFATPEETKKKIMTIVTDSRGATDPKDPATCNIFALHKLFTSDLSALEERYRTGTISYKESKELLADSVNAYLAPFRAKKAELDANPDFVNKVLADGAAKARAIADEKMKLVRARTGFSA